MIDHETARRSFATSLDFPLEPAEREALDAHLAACPSCRAFATSVRADAALIRDLDSGPVPAAVRANVAIAAEHGRGSSAVGRWVGIGVFAALLLAVVGAGTLGVGGRGGGPATPGDGDGAAPSGEVHQIVWKTEVVALVADRFSIDVGGKTYLAATPKVEVDSDPGTATYRTLEATWHENGVEMRMNMYFGGDSTAWWVDEIRIYDGRTPSDWLTTRGTFFKTQVGAAWTGDQDVAFTEATGRQARLHLGGATLATQPVVGGKPGIGGGPLDGAVTSEVGKGPFDPGGALHCSGILQMTPTDAGLTLWKMGLKVGWRHYTQNDSFIDGPSEPPPGTVIIDDGSNVVGSEGQILIALADVTSPLAKPVPYPADCPRADPNVTPPTPVPAP